MIEKILIKQFNENHTATSFNMDILNDNEKDFAIAMWIAGWNAFMEILPNITPDELLIDGKFPYNREYTDDKEPLVRYFSKGLQKFNKNKIISK